jgi:hypothetical protein
LHTIVNMIGSDFTISNRVRAVFSCDGSHISVYFKYEDNRVGKTTTLTRAEAADLGERIAKTGEWEEFPLSLGTSDFKSFGVRLRDYGIHGC